MEYVGEYDFQGMDMKAYGLLNTLWNYQRFCAMGEV